MTIPCDRENILDFIHHVRSKFPQRTAEEIDRQIREERDSWDNDEYPDWTTEELMQLSMQGGSFDFWHDEPDLYTLEDGEPIQWE
jgi:hypothetical protein